jgi:hypothetical protein
VSSTFIPPPPPPSVSFSIFPQETRVTVGKPSSDPLFYLASELEKSLRRGDAEVVAMAQEIVEWEAAHPEEMQREAALTSYIAERNRKEAKAKAPKASKALKAPRIEVSREGIAKFVEPRTCDICQVEFTPANPRAVSCSDACRAEKKRRQVGINRKPKAETLTRAQKKLIEDPLYCVDCASPLPNRLSTRCRLCALKIRRESKAKSQQVLRAKKPVASVCVVCNADFFASWNGKKTCSKECQSKLLSETVTNLIRERRGQA